MSGLCAFAGCCASACLSLSLFLPVMCGRACAPRAVSVVARHRQRLNRTGRSIAAFATPPLALLAVAWVASSGGGTSAHGIIGYTVTVGALVSGGPFRP